MKKSELRKLIRELIKEEVEDDTVHVGDSQSGVAFIDTPHPAVSSYYNHQTLPSNFTNRMNNKGCSYLIGTKGKMEQKLLSKQSQSINPRWQQLLQGKIDYVDTLIQQLDSIMPADSGWSCPPPPTGMISSEIYKMNFHCRTGMASC